VVKEVIIKDDIWFLLGVSEIPGETPEHKRKENKHVQIYW
jgi:hypothetical protein